MLRRTTVLAIALGIVASLVVPGIASATWKHHMQAIQQNVTLGFTGQARFKGALGGLECQVTSRVKFLQGQTTGEVETFVPDPTSATANCEGLEGLAFCEVHNVAPSGLNWLIHTRTGPDRAEVTFGNITAQTTGAFCPISHALVTAGIVSANPNQPNTVSSVSLVGAAQADLKTNNNEVHKESVVISGSLEIENPNKNTYSI